MLCAFIELEQEPQPCICNYYTTATFEFLQVCTTTVLITSHLSKLALFGKILY